MGSILSLESLCFIESQALSLLDPLEVIQHHVVLLYCTCACEVREHLVCLTCTSATQDGQNQLSSWHAAVLHLYLEVFNRDSQLWESDLFPFKTYWLINHGCRMLLQAASSNIWLIISADMGNVLQQAASHLASHPGCSLLCTISSFYPQNVSTRFSAVKFWSYGYHLAVYIIHPTPSLWLWDALQAIRFLSSPTFCWFSLSKML